MLANYIGKGRARILKNAWPTRALNRVSEATKGTVITRWRGLHITGYLVTYLGTGDKTRGSSGIRVTQAEAHKLAAQMREFYAAAPGSPAS